MHKAWVFVLILFELGCSPSTHGGSIHKDADTVVCNISRFVSTGFTKRRGLLSTILGSLKIPMSDIEFKEVRSEFNKSEFKIIFSGLHSTQPRIVGNLGSSLAKVEANETSIKIYELGQDNLYKVNLENGALIGTKNVSFGKATYGAVYTGFCDEPLLEKGNL